MLCRTFHETGLNGDISISRGSIGVYWTFIKAFHLIHGARFILDGLVLRRVVETRLGPLGVNLL